MNRKLKQEAHFGNIFPGNQGHGTERVENRHRDHTPKGVYEKLGLLIKDEKFKQTLTAELNGTGLDFEKHPNMFEGVERDDLMRVSSLIGDIRFHVSAANDQKYDYTNDVREIATILRKLA